jgi:outer membrane protein assembly factor BamD
MPLRFLLFIFAIAALASCSKYSKLLKSTDVELKYTKAVEYYDAGDYAKALSLFDELGTLFRGTARSEAVHHYIANCHYHLKDYYFASYYYKNFAKTYPNSPLAEESLFKSAFCAYKNSPNPSLDQRDTNQAIDEFQLFLDKYPNTALKDSANKMIDELRLKLETKAYNSAKLYYQTENYKSAAIALNNLLREFPESKHAEEIEFLIVKSQYLLAINSIDSKKEERFTATIESYHKFVDHFKSSKYLKQAETYYANAVKELERMKF